ncbi:cutinase-domain-containing protein [Aspergillus avenaceus]|uniref:Cutinase n=1 Tax=Aspergillus avenaceus TaxID=36643 RepID=A0A5N6TL99_ASPAV|nr:cutinase-domain-containing protein [Aspergillus avenaceus]
MKAVAALALVGSALAAPTRTVEERQLPDLSSLMGGGSSSDSSDSSSSGLGGLGSLLGGGSSSGSGLGALSSMLPSSSSGSSGGLPDLGSLFGGGGSSTGSGLGALSSMLPSSSSSSSDSSSSDSAPSDSSSDSGSSGLGGLGGLLGGSSSTGKLPDISSLLGGSGLTKRAGMTENGVTENKGCQPLTFIFARGTTELGNMGSVVGPPVANQLSSLTGGKVTVQGVDYPADAAGNAMMGASGGPKMASLIQQAKKQCPDTKVVLGGYSQGSMVVHNAANRVGADAISGAVLFGDPFKMTGVGKVDKSKVKEFCAAGDPVCENGMNVMAHLTYGADAKTAAQFLVSAAGVSS